MPKNTSKVNSPTLYFSATKIHHSPCFRLKPIITIILCCTNPHTWKSNYSVFTSFIALVADSYISSRPEFISFGTLFDAFNLRCWTEINQNNKTHTALLPGYGDSILICFKYFSHELIKDSSFHRALKLIRVYRSPIAFFFSNSL